MDCRPLSSCHLLAVPRSYFSLSVDICIWRFHCCFNLSYLEWNTESCPFPPTCSYLKAPETYWVPDSCFICICGVVVCQVACFLNNPHHVLPALTLPLLWFGLFWRGGWGRRCLCPNSEYQLWFLPLPEFSSKSEHLTG